MAEKKQVKPMIPRIYRICAWIQLKWWMDLMLNINSCHGDRDKRNDNTIYSFSGETEEIIVEDGIKYLVTRTAVSV